MKPTSWLVVARVILASLLMATLAGAGAQQSIPAAASGTGERGTATGAAEGEPQISAHDLALAAAYLRPIGTVLEGKLDARTARPGDRMAVRTIRDTFLADGTEIPKGSRLVGHVTEVEAHSKDHPDSLLSFALDRVELKYGINVPIHATVQAVAPPAAGAPDAPMMGGNNGFGNAASMSANASMSADDDAIPGGGPVGGAARNSGRTGGQLDPQGAGALDGNDRVAGSAVGPVDRTMAGNGVGGFSTRNHATEIPGVMVRGYIVGSASGTLTAAGKDVRLESGSQMLLGVAAK